MKKLSYLIIVFFIGCKNGTYSDTYYTNLAKKCKTDSKISSVNCCLASVNYMQKGRFKLIPQSLQCPEGYRKNMFMCIDTYVWCEPGK
jgi:hydroxylamine reductase (hybrid-cluster protein)